MPQPKNTLKAASTVESLSKKGVVFATDLCADSKGELLTYEGADGIEHWVGFHNFFVITRYNRSAMYALAAHQLGQEIAQEVSGRCGLGCRCWRSALLTLAACGGNNVKATDRRSGSTRIPDLPGDADAAP